MSPKEIFGKSFAAYSVSVCFIYLYRIPAVTEFVESGPLWIMLVVAAFFGIPAIMGYFLGGFGSVVGILLFFLEYTKEEIDVPWICQAISLIVTAVFIGILIVTDDALGF